MERGVGVLLVGEAGVGKSHLLHAALELAAGKGADVVRVGFANGAVGNAFGSLVEWLGPHFAEQVGVPYQRCDEGAGNSKAPFVGKLVLGIDDAHLLDPPSAATLHHLVAFNHVILVAAVRAGIPAPEGVSRLWVERLAERMEISPFDRSAVAEVLHAKLGSSVDTATSEKLWTVTRGNALFLRELVEYTLAEGSLRKVSGRWRWSGLGGADSRLVDLVNMRLGHLDSDEADLVGMIALAEPLPADLPVVAELGHAAESLNRRGVVVTERVGGRLRLRLAYPLCSEVVVASMPELTGHRLRGQLADAIERTDAASDHDVLRMVTLRLDTGRTPTSAQLLAAAMAAARQSDFTLAERLCVMAREADGAEPSLRATILLGHALAGQGRHAEAEAVFATASAADASPAERAELVQARVNTMAWGLQRVDEAVGIIDRALTGPHAVDCDRLRVLRAVMWILSDRLAEVVEDGRGLLRGEPLSSSLAQAMVPPVVFALSELGRPGEALALVERYRCVQGQWGDDARLAYQVLAVRTAFLAGRTVEADFTPDWMSRCLSDEHLPTGLSRVAVTRARILRSLGRQSAAISVLRQASTLRADRDWLTTRAWTLAQLAGALAEAGQHAEALRTLAEARFLREPALPYPIAADAVAIEEILVHAYAGDCGPTIRRALELAGRCVAAGRATQALELLHMVARFGAAGPAFARIPDVATRVESALGALQIDHVTALAHGDGDALTDVSQRFRGIGFLPLAAEAAAQAARAYQSAGRHRRSRVAKAECQEILTGHGGRLPPWVRLGADSNVGQRTELTTREREVAALAADGMSNRDIAERLVVSVRTVENHLQRVYDKLGITARAELANNLDRLSASSSATRSPSSSA